MLLGGIVVAGLALVGIVAVRRLLRPKPTFGYIIDKRVHYGSAYRGVASVAMGTAPLPIIPPRYQLLLQRKNEKPNWIDVTREQYGRAQEGQLWPDE